MIIFSMHIHTGLSHSVIGRLFNINNQLTSNQNYINILFVCLFVCLFVSRSTRQFFTHTEKSSLPGKGCSALMAIEQWGFCSVQHLLWHGVSVYNGNFRGPVTLTPIAERLEMGCHYLFLRLRSIPAGFRTTDLPLARRSLYHATPPPRWQRG